MPIVKRSLLAAIVLCFGTLASAPLWAQTFEVPGQEPQKQAPAPKGKQKGKTAPKSASPQASTDQSTGIGWGNSIEVGRMARAAQDALKRKNYSAAQMYAQRAVTAAPQEGKLWFLLGYTSRLAGKYQTSLDAYNRGLKTRPNSPEGLSGIAQTYNKMGRSAEAARLLNQLIAAHPDRVNDILILGEIYIRSGQLQQGIATLQRAEARKPSAHVELLMAMGYLRLKQPQQAKALLDKARQRDPKNVDIFRAVASYYREQHDYAAAIKTLRSAPRMTGTVLADLGFTYELAGDRKSAASTYVRAANASPKEIKYQLSAAQALITQGDIERGKQFLTRAAAIDSNHYRLHSIRAGLSKQENHLPAAIEDYKLAIANLPEGVPPEGQLYPVLLHLNLAEAYRVTQDEANSRQQMAIAEEAIKTMDVQGTARAEFLRVRSSVELAFGDAQKAEDDLKQALALDPQNVLIQLQYGNLLWKTGRPALARQLFEAVLKSDPKNHNALEAAGYLARDTKDRAAAEHYFNAMAQAYPDDYIPYLALADMDSESKQYDGALKNYEQAFLRAKTNPTIIANAANTAIEARQMNVAEAWVGRATGSMVDDPHIMLERQRVLFHRGKFTESVALGQKVVKALPKDRNASVYLGYGYYNLGRLDDVLALVAHYEQVLPKEGNFPLLAGHVHKRSQLLDQSIDDYTRALERNPRMVDAYVNRGYAYNDLQNGEQAIQDFQTALKLEPANGTAHLGLAFANLQLHHARAALAEADAAQSALGESGATHLAKATAYRQMRALTKAETEYRAAIAASPNDPGLHLALANTLYHTRRYNQSVQELQEALRFNPQSASLIYAEMAHSYAQLGQHDNTLRYVDAAEKEGGESTAVLLDTGEALLELGDRDAAMKRFTRALNAPDADRVSARLAFAKLFVRENKPEDAKQQIALAFAESRVGEASPITADNLVEAANVFLAARDFDLAENYFKRAKAAGAEDTGVALGLANTYLAKGDDRAAEAELAALGSPQDFAGSYDYALASGLVYRDRRDPVRSLGYFARANELAGDERSDTAERLMLESAGEHGLPVWRNLSASSDTTFSTILDDATIYQLDNKLLRITDPALLVPPRFSRELRSYEAFHYLKNGLPPLTGFFQVRNARGELSLPSQALIVDRNTYDYSFGGGISPTLRLGRNSIHLQGGIEYTIRRDQGPFISQFGINQNLFRQYLYADTSSFFNWVSVRASGYHEAGPFTERDLHSKDVAGRLEFTVGRPWGRNALVTGYYARDLQFDPLIREYFTTSTYAGFSHKFGESFKTTVLGEYIRSWRVQDLSFAIAQAMRPSLQLEYAPNARWNLQGSFALDRGEGFHTYDNTQSEFLISYQKPVHRMLRDGGEEVPVGYPIRFSFGIQHQNFMNFSGANQTIFRPIVRLTLF